MKRILVVSPGSFLKSDNDGLTLSNMFKEWDKGCFAQFYIQGMPQDEEFCQNFYRVTDRQVLSTVLPFHITKPSSTKTESSIKQENNKRFKSPINMLLRNLAWRSKLWMKKDFKKWLDDFAPEIVFLEIGDNASQIDLACSIAKKRNIPLVLHNTEAFFFFKKNYMPRKSFKNNLTYPLFRLELRRSYKKAMKLASMCIYSCEKLRRIYDNAFPGSKSEVLYNSYTNLPSRFETDSICISYLGNLAFNRPLVLTEVAKVLQTVDSSLTIDVYGHCNTESDLQLLKTSKGITYHGSVPYEEVLNVISRSTILLHVEHPSCISSTEYGFSTKIPDSLASGSCFIVYAPLDVAGVSYLHDNIPEIVATNMEELDLLLNRVVSDKEFRSSCISKELQLAATNHESSTISKKFSNIINDL